MRSGALVGRGAQGTGRVVRPANDGGVLLFGYFILGKQEKVTQGAGAERSQLGFKTRATSAHNHPAPSKGRKTA